jgi:hypothetical protein
MPKGNVNKNPNDPRAARSVRDIKNRQCSSRDIPQMEGLRMPQSLLIRGIAETE